MGKKKFVRCAHFKYTIAPLQNIFVLLPSEIFLPTPPSENFYIRPWLCQGFIMSSVCYVWGLSCLGFVMSRVCRIQGMLCLGFVMSRVCYVQGLLCLGFVVSSVCYVQGLLCLGFVVSRVLYCSICKPYKLFGISNHLPLQSRIEI